MADDNNNSNDDEQQRRRLEAKREYNRVLSAQKRQRTKDEITALAAQVEFHADRADKLETKNVELLQLVQVLTAERQRLHERIQQQQLTISNTNGSSSSSSRRSATTTTTIAGGGGGGGLLVAGPLPANAHLLHQGSSTGGGGDRHALATGATAFGTEAWSPPPPLSTDVVDQRYLQLARLLSGVAGSNGGGGGGGGGFDPVLGIDSSRSAAALPARGGQLLDHLLASSLVPPIYNNDTARQRPLSQVQELDLLIRLSNNVVTSNSTNSTNTSSSSFPINAFLRGFNPRGDAESLIRQQQQRGILAALSEPRRRPSEYATSTTTNTNTAMDALHVAQLLVCGGGVAGQEGTTSPRIINTSRVAANTMPIIPADGDNSSRNILRAPLLLGQQQEAGRLWTGSSSQSATAAGFLDQHPHHQGSTTNNSQSGE
jgi:hypothetical protein